MDFNKIEIVANSTSADQIGILLALILESGIKGSLSRNDAEKIFGKIMIGIQTNITRANDLNSEADKLVVEILNCWALPIIMEKGISLKKK